MMDGEKLYLRGDFSSSEDWGYTLHFGFNSKQGGVLMAGLVGHKSITDGLFQMLMQAERNIKADVQDRRRGGRIAGLEAGVGGPSTTRRPRSPRASLTVTGPGTCATPWTRRVQPQQATTTTVRVGWLTNAEGYFLIQNDGGDVNGTTVTPMNALMNAHNAITDTLKGWGMKIL